jgi:hypothetical protein
LRTATQGEGRSKRCVALRTPPDSGARRRPVVLIAFADFSIDSNARLRLLGGTTSDAGGGRCGLLLLLLLLVTAGTGCICRCGVLPPLPLLPLPLPWLLLLRATLSGATRVCCLLHGRRAPYRMLLLVV